MSDDWSLVPKRIKDFRILYKRKQEELGEALNLPKQAISAIERGKRKVNVEELSKISKFFNEPFDAFFAKEFKFDYYPKNLYGSFPKFIVDFLDDYKYFLDKLEKEVAKLKTELAGKDKLIGELGAKLKAKWANAAVTHIVKAPQANAYIKALPKSVTAQPQKKN